VCYRKGGYLAITDANLLLGRILPDFFPKIFGPNEDEPLDKTAARYSDYSDCRDLVTCELSHHRRHLRKPPRHMQPDAGFKTIGAIPNSFATAGQLF
jgi:5-oxoprolinase (ATP-hydrolysing)